MSKNETWTKIELYKVKLVNIKIEMDKLLKKT